MTKITALPASGAITSDMLLEMVFSPSGAPESRKATVAQLLTFFGPFKALGTETGVSDTTYPWGDVRRYGAVAGAADTRTQINNAITSVAAGGGGEVFAPGGTFDVSDKILLKAGVWLAGAGIGKTVLRKTDSTKELIELRATSATIARDFGVRDMTLEGSRTTTTYNFNRNAIVLSWCEDFVIERVHAKSMENDALILEYCRSGVVHNCRITDTNKQAIYLSGSDYIRVTNNDCRENLGGISLSGSWYVTVVGNVCRTWTDSPYPGLQAGRDSGSCTITGNYADGFHVEPGYIIGVHPFAYDHPGHTATYDGVTTYGINNFTITGNVFGNNPLKTVSAVGMKLQQVVDSIVADNIVSDVANFGLYVYNCTRLKVTNNKIRNCGGSGNFSAVFVGGGVGALTTDTTFDGNEYDDNRIGAAAVMGGMTWNAYATGTRIRNQRWGTWLNPIYHYSCVAGQITELVLTDAATALDAASATPVVAASSVYTVAASATNVTGFSALPVPRAILLMFSGARTVVASATLKLAGGVNFVGAANSVLTLRTLDGTTWQEVSRSVN